MLRPADVALTGRVAVVTGGGAGIGRGIAETFAAFGARIAIWDVDPDRAAAAAAAIAGAGGDALAVTADVRDGDAVARAVAATVDRFDGIDALVNNVGGAFHAAFLTTREKAWEALHRANLRHVYHCTQAVAARMVAQGRGGSVVNVTSIEGVRAAPGYAAYAAAKAGVIAFTKTMALELAPHGIRVNALAPDICATEGLAALVPPGERARWRWIVPLGRAAEPDDVAGAAVFLVSALGRYVTGVTLHVDGGTHAAGGWYRDPDGGAWTLGPPRRAP